MTLLIFAATPPFRGLEVTDKAQITREHVDVTRRSITSRYLDEEVSMRFTERRRGNGAVIRIPAHSARVWDLAPITSP